MTQEKVTEEDLKTVTEAAQRKKELTKLAEDAVLKAKNAELQHQVVVQHIFIKYGLTFNDKIDDATGEITREEPEVAKTAEATGFVKTGDAEGEN